MSGRGYYQGDQGYGPPQYGRGNGGERPKKHTGAKKGLISKGEYQGDMYVSAWNYSKRRGMTSLLAVPYKDTREHDKSGRKWLTYICKVSMRDQGVERIEPVLVDANTGQFTLRSMGWVINPGAPRGGYCGTFSQGN